ncbi:MAG: DNA primase [bacterium]|nr:DNA primase [bacterium]
MPGRIPPEIVDRIREGTDIVELISGYVRLERKGVNYFGLCPFHPEKTPSFSVHPAKGIFHCFGCGIGGNSITFLQLHDKLSFAEAARELARRTGIHIPEEKSTERPEKYDALYKANQFAAELFSKWLWENRGDEFDRARAYLQQRGISNDLAKLFKIGYSQDRWDGLIQAIRRDKPGILERDFLDAGLLLRKEGGAYDRFRGRLIFPIHNLSGKVVAFGGRAMQAETEGAKYINSPQTPIYNKSGILYGLHLAVDQIKRRGECLIVEGYTDLIRLHEGGFAHAVATSGTALTREQASLLRRFCNKVVLVYDGDAAGSHASLRGGDVLVSAGLNVKVVGLPPEHDPDSFIKENGPGAFAELVENATDLISYRIELYRREGRLTDAPSRTAVARELLASLIVIPDPIQREIQAQEAAAKMGLSAETVLRELARMRVPSRSQSETAGNGAKPGESLTALPVKEKGLLEALIRWPELREAVFLELPAQEFQGTLSRRLAAKLEDAWSKGEKPTGEALIDEDTPIEDVSFISWALSQTESLTDPGVDAQAKRRYDDYITAQDCLKDLLIALMDQQLQKLKLKINAEPDETAQITLLKELQDQEGQKLAIKKKVFWPIPPHPSLEAPGERASKKSPTRSRQTDF